MVNRLTAQVGSKEKAVGILRDLKYMKKDSEELTKKGTQRDKLTARERAIDRAAKVSGKPKSQFRYDKNTNRAILKKDH